MTKYHHMYENVPRILNYQNKIREKFSEFYFWSKITCLRTFYVENIQFSHFGRLRVNILGYPDEIFSPSTVIYEVHIMNTQKNNDSDIFSTFQCNTLRNTLVFVFDSQTMRTSSIRAGVILKILIQTFLFNGQFYKNCF